MLVRFSEGGDSGANGAPEVVCHCTESSLGGCVIVLAFHREEYKPFLDLGTLCRACPLLLGLG